MALVDIDSLEPGMKVGRDVVEASGQVLLRTGTEINEKHLRILRSWGVEQVDVEGANRTDPEEALLGRADPALLDRAQAVCNERFHHADMNHPAVAELMRLALLAEVRHAVENQVP